MVVTTEQYHDSLFLASLIHDFMFTDFTPDTIDVLNAIAIRYHEELVVQQVRSICSCVQCEAYTRRTLKY